MGEEGITFFQRLVCSERHSTLGFVSPPSEENEGELKLHQAVPGGQRQEEMLPSLKGTILGQKTVWREIQIAWQQRKACPTHRVGKTQISCDASSSDQTSCECTV